MAVAIVITAAAVAMTIVAMIGNAEHAVDGTDCAADACTDCAADHRTDRTRRAAALARTFLRAADDALRVPEMGDREPRQRGGGCSTVTPRPRAGRQRCCLDAGL